MGYINSIKMGLVTIAVGTLLLAAGVDLRLSLLEGSHYFGQISNTLPPNTTASTTAPSNGGNYRAALFSTLSFTTTDDSIDLQKDNVIGSNLNVSSSSTTNTPLRKGEDTIWEFLTNDGVLEPLTLPKKRLLKSNSPMKNWKLIDTIIHSGMVFIKTKAHQLAKAGLGMLIKLDSKSLNKGFQLVMKRLSDVLGWVILKLVKFLDHVFHVIREIGRGRGKGGSSGKSDGSDNNNGDRSEGSNGEGGDTKVLLAHLGTILSSSWSYFGESILLRSLFSNGGLAPPLPLNTSSQTARASTANTFNTFEDQRRWIEVAMANTDHSCPFNHFNIQLAQRSPPPFRYLHSLAVGILAKESMMLLMPPVNASIAWDRTFGSKTISGTSLSSNSKHRLTILVMDVIVAVFELLVFMGGATWLGWELAKLTSFAFKTIHELRAVRSHQQFMLLVSTQRTVSRRCSALLIAIAIVSLSATQLLLDYTLPDLNCIPNGLFLSAFACVVRTETNSLRGVLRSTNAAANLPRVAHHLPIPNPLWPALSLALVCTATLFSGNVHIALPFLFYGVGSIVRIMKARRLDALSRVRIFAGLSAVLQGCIVTALILLATAPFSGCEGSLFEILGRTMAVGPQDQTPGQAMNILKESSLLNHVDPSTVDRAEIVSRLSLFVAILLGVGASMAVAMRKATGSYRIEHDSFVSAHQLGDTTALVRGESLKARESLRPEAFLVLVHSAAATIETVINVATVIAISSLVLEPYDIYASVLVSRVTLVSTCLIIWICIRMVNSNILREFGQTPGVGLNSAASSYLNETLRCVVWAGVGLLSAHCYLLPLSFEVDSIHSWQLTYRALLLGAFTVTAFVAKNVLAAPAWRLEAMMVGGVGLLLVQASVPTQLLNTGLFIAIAVRLVCSLWIRTIAFS